MKNRVFLKKDPIEKFQILNILTSSNDHNCLMMSSPTRYALSFIDIYKQNALLTNSTLENPGFTPLVTCFPFGSTSIGR